MDINEQLQPIITSLIDSLKVSIEAELKSQVTDEIVRKLASTEINSIVEKQINERVTARINAFDFESVTKTHLDRVVTQLVKEANSALTTAANQQIVTEINKRVANLDLNKTVNQIVDAKIGNMVNISKFPERSISHTCIDFSNVELSGDNIKGGIIEGFGSQGIEDRASSVQMTILDNAVAFENAVWAPEVKVKGKLSIDGDLIVNGRIAEDSPAFANLIVKTSELVNRSINDDLFKGFSDIVLERIKVEGIDMDKFTQGGKEVVKGNQLGYHIVDTNIQRLGLVKDLQTQGEALLTNTLYTTDGRVGINTMDPSAALSIWDEEVEITLHKRSQDVAVIGTPRRQNLIISSNGKENILLDVDGSVKVNTITIGKMTFGSSPATPDYSGQPGQVVWNERPSLGGPMGWVCLSGTQWANFGVID